MKIAVAGGTGVVGRHVVDAVRAAGHEPAVLARSTGVDLVSGSGLSTALDGAGAVIDVSNVTAMSRRKSEGFFEAATTNLLEASKRAGVGHVAALSIVGSDRVDLGYYLGKRRQEALLLASGQPVSVLRATQFHEFPSQLLDRMGGPIAVVPRMRSQPVAAREVAEALLTIALSGPVGLAAEMAGPEVHEMPDLARLVLRARGSRRPVIPLPLPGATGRELAGGGLLPTQDGPRGTQTFTEWLTSQPD